MYVFVKCFRIYPDQTKTQPENYNLSNSVSIQNNRIRNDRFNVCLQIKSKNYVGAGPCIGTKLQKWVFNKIDDMAR